MKMTFEEWQKENSCEYKGYIIRPGTILDKAGDAVCMWPTEIDVSREKFIKQGREIIDGWEAESK
jgi:hypothetical protein